MASPYNSRELLRHWHPVHLSRKLRKKPVRIELCGQQIVLFRASDGTIGALSDRCPHRHMRLSNGWIEKDRLVCPFHGWSYNHDGHGLSRSTPGLNVCAESFDTADRHGLIWVKNKESTAQLPQLDLEGYQLVCQLEHVVTSPLDMLLDINSEIEHAALVHTFFGHSLGQVDDVEVEYDFSSPETTRIHERLPQKILPRILQPLFSVRDRDLFIDEVTFHFSPVHKISQLTWQDRQTGKDRQEKLRSAYFFTPMNGNATKWFSIYLIQSPRWGQTIFELLQKPILKTIMNHEGCKEASILSMLAEQQTNDESMVLGRLDNAITANRQRLQNIYHRQLLC
jgi:phenylpropionate dioxygenase-like ring-hydroxylating dioxygenase large terminal subunit